MLLRFEGVMPHRVNLLQLDVIRDEATQLPPYYPFVLILEFKVSVKAVFIGRIKRLIILITNWLLHF